VNVSVTVGVTPGTLQPGVVGGRFVFGQPAGDPLGVVQEPMSVVVHGFCSHQTTALLAPQSQPGFEVALGLGTSLVQVLVSGLVHSIVSGLVHSLVSGLVHSLVSVLCPFLVNFLKIEYAITTGVVSGILSYILLSNFVAFVTFFVHPIDSGTTNRLEHSDLK